jgi:hypothetical protein
MVPRFSIAASLLALVGCTFMEKCYVTEAAFPHGERLSGILSWEHPHELVVSYPGLDVSVGGDAATIAQWVSPAPLPSLIPIPTDAWTRPRRVTVLFSLFPHREGYTLSPMRTRLQEERAQAVAAERWQGPWLAGVQDARSSTAHTDDDEIPIDKGMYVVVVFPVVSPLEGPAELHVEGLRRDARPVAFPTVPLWPKYYTRGGGVP